MNVTEMPVQSESILVNTIRFLSVDAVEKANSGHPGLPMGAAAMAYVLWTRFLKHNPSNPAWFDRDRFVLSAGHGSMLLYSLLHLTGYDVPLDQIKRFRQWGSMAAGHPERGLAPGVETTTGPLGQGFANGVGMAMAEAFLAARYNRPGFSIIDHFTYGIVSDGDLMEGVASEAASLAGHLGLGKLVYLYDDNGITLAGSTDLTFDEDVGKRFEAYGWDVQVVPDGNDTAAVERAIAAARAETRRPSLIVVRTHIGYGAPRKQDTFEAHGSPLGEDEVRRAKEDLGWPLDPPFYVPDEALAYFRQAVDRGKAAERAWDERFARYEREHPDPARELRRAMCGELPEGWDAGIPDFPADARNGVATRVAFGKVLNAVAARVPTLVGGSGDLNPSTHTALAGLGDFQNPRHERGRGLGAVGGQWGYDGRNIAFGVREHAMAAAANGMAAHGGVFPYCATFFAFSDYMRPAIRLAAIMGLPVLFIFTHDGIGLGEDGTTHQPIEHLASLRAMPGLVVIRPADANEAAVAARVALETRNRPVAIVLTRQDVPVIDRSRCARADGLRHGAYVLSDVPDGRMDVILVATGSEVSLALAAQEILGGRGIAARVVSMPSWELFEEQPRECRESVLPPSVPARLAIEAGASFGWCRWVGEGGDVLGIDRFGSSAPGAVLMREYGFTPENIAERALALHQRRKEG